jgi:hypothetical protein
MTDYSIMLKSIKEYVDRQGNHPEDLHLKLCFICKNYMMSHSFVGSVCLNCYISKNNKNEVEQ